MQVTTDGVILSLFHTKNNRMMIQQRVAEGQSCSKSLIASSIPLLNVVMDK